MGPLPTFRIPYTNITHAAHIHPPSATTVPAAVAALVRFLRGPPSSHHPPSPSSPSSPSLSSTTTILTGAGLSVSSGLADYRGAQGTYRLNRDYRPIYFPEFLASHEARQRYWARSFLGWGTLTDARPNAAHRAIGDLARLGLVGAVVTQNVDSFHPRAHPHLPTVELHGYLRRTVCVSCGGELDRARFQDELTRLNPAWKRFLDDVLSADDQRAALGIRTNPDGDIEW
jgi:NAD-dependent deacetylase sirtuin 4